MLNSFYLKETEESPSFEFIPEKNTFIISGRSLPENANTIFDPIFDWLKLYFQNPNPTITFIIKLDYMNSCSKSKIVELFTFLQSELKKGQSIEIKWFYELEDITIKNEGEELLNLFELPFELISY